eukprot:CAMPEP_0113311630 /NCGR_PEP_ID=MMETSP0010_2-20120614/8787_1 /TAXON_ID=216773 ORGANISM="Corethron hystrix, Strain 308" /NCGR_SAMPLE_ID=MMETSP0010_2 /ASSEMBLY_ACC=CAM_ASM_000155 /LENGTH=296 /DNA_ID=CAMNT_0000167301 /DNA_START=197 /DNA_END=1087 /DNA_ORIENTATION=- /assembly_acc=CAM_ASM_000155
MIFRDRGDDEATSVSARARMQSAPPTLPSWLPDPSEGPPPQFSRPDGDDVLPSPAAFVGILSVITLAAVSVFLGQDIGVVTTFAEEFDPQQLLTDAVVQIEAAGAMGYLYFGVIYTIAEILAIPAIPLTASAGYLFGVLPGTAVVLVAASVAASVSFLLGRYALRGAVEKILEDNPRFKAMDAAIGKEGFKLMLLLRLSPIFPFALSNYLYGVTSVRFWPYFWGTMLGFAPGTLAYVYTGEFGKALTMDAGMAAPWYIYAGGLALGACGIKIIADIATRTIEDMEAMEEAAESTSL